MNSARYESSVRPEDPPWVRCSPADTVALGLVDGDAVEVRSAHGAVLGTLRIDDRLRPGVVSLTHGWSSTNVSRLTSVVDEVDPLTGMICQGAIPVSVRPA
jgi:anaerobic selenocysteine-containing dehydrogenase